MIILLFVMFFEERHEWKKIQKTYYKEYALLIKKKIEEVTKASKEDELKKWTALKNDLARSKNIGIRQVFIPEAGRRDLCATCHMGMENTLFADAKNPMKSHPTEILKKHKINNFGCTLCHQGQGVALTIDKAHGIEHNWEQPKLPVKYFQASCFGCHENVHALEGAEIASKGKSLFTDHGCQGCHNANILKELPFFSTPFNVISKKVKNEAYIYKWIENPDELRPGTFMPTFRLKEDEVRDIASYVYTLDGKVNFKASQGTQGDSAVGKSTFTEKGCIACHSDERDKPCLKGRVPKIADAGLKLDKKWVYTWIDTPSSVNPQTAMPNIELTADEIVNLTAYVMNLKDPAVGEKIAFEYKPGNPEKGKILLQSVGCYGCHKIEGMEGQALVGVDVSEVAKKRMEELPFGNSTVTHTKWDWIFNKIKKPEIYLTVDMPLKMPNFKLEDTDIDALTTFYLNNRLYDLKDNFLVKDSRMGTAREKGDYLIERLNCNGCHEVYNAKLPRIANYLSLKTMVPPRIVGEGERVQPQWLFQYINRPFSMRPWLKLRMPVFNMTHDEKAFLIEYFVAVLPESVRTQCKMPYEPKLARSDFDDESIQMGEYRIVSDKCMQCHPVSMDAGLPEGKKVEDLSINLMIAKERLRQGWIVNFMRNPDDYAGKDTKMPFVFYTPDRVPRIPDPEMWLQLAANYLMVMDKVPEGKPLEEKKREEADVDWTAY
jgi:mono/diheme cytochrome c family protein